MVYAHDLKSCFERNVGSSPTPGTNYCKICYTKKMSTITIDDFKKVEIRAGKILTAEKIPDTDKLLRLTVDFAEKDAAGTPAPRQIVSGIASYFPDPRTLVGTTCMFITNLEPRVIRGQESNGMLLAVSDDAGNFSILEPNPSIAPGALAK